MLISVLILFWQIVGESEKKLSQVFEAGKYILYVLFEMNIYHIRMSMNSKINWFVSLP